MSQPEEGYILNSSPYGGDMYKVFFEDGEPSWVHAKVLKRHPELLRRVRKPDGLLGSHCLDLKGIESLTGHVILHYLYTGTYKCLKAPDPALIGKVDMARYELAEGLQVCVAAYSLQMGNLRNIAEKEIERLGDQLSVAHMFDIIDIMDFQLNRVPTFKSYLESRIGQARFGGPQDTIEDVLQDLGTTNTLSKLTLKTMVLQHTSRMEWESKTKAAPIAQHHTTASDLSRLEKRPFSDGDEKEFSDLNPHIEKSCKDKGPANREKLMEASSSEAKPGPVALASTTKDTVEAWLDHGPDSNPSSLPDPESHQDDTSISPTFSAGMTPSSNGSSWHALESGSTE